MFKSNTKNQYPIQTNFECRKVKCGAKPNKNWAKSTKYASCTSSQQYFISPFRSYQLEVQDQININKCECILENTSVRLIWSAEKVKCEAKHINNWAKWTKYASCTFSWQYFLRLLRFYRLEVQDNRNFILGVFLTNIQNYDKGIIVAILFISFVYLCNRRSQRLQCQLAAPLTGSIL